MDQSAFYRCIFMCMNMYMLVLLEGLIVMIVLVLITGGLVLTNVTELVVMMSVIELVQITV